MENQPPFSWSTKRLLMKSKQWREASRNFSSPVISQALRKPTTASFCSHQLMAGVMWPVRGSYSVSMAPSSRCPCSRQARAMFTQVSRAARCASGSPRTSAVSIISQLPSMSWPKEISGVVGFQARSWK